MKSLLPTVDTLESYIPLFRDPSAWLPALREICRRHRLDSARLDFAPPGSNVVFWLGQDRLIKLFPPVFAADFTPERLALEALADQTEFAVPRIHHSGELEGWPYLVLSRLPGASLDVVWPGLDPRGRERIAAGLGRMLAALHRTPTQPLAGLGRDWGGFVQAQLDQLPEYQRKAGASEEWLADIAAFYAALPPLVEPGFRPVLLNADLNPEHIFCRETGAGWEVSGMIDFGDAMLGDPGYEFVCPAFFLAGDPAPRRALLLAYGIPAAALTAELSRRLTAYILLHRFISVPQFPELFPQRPPANMRELEEIAWSF